MTVCQLPGSRSLSALALAASLAELYHFRLGPGALFGKMLGTASFSTFAFIHLWT